jgi:hypothetical protein
VGKGLKRGPKGYVDGGLGGQGKIPSSEKIKGLMGAQGRELAYYFSEYHFKKIKASTDIFSNKPSIAKA